MKHFNLNIGVLFFTILFLLGAGTITKAQVKASNPKQLTISNDWSFVENIGQLAAPNPLKDNTIDMHSDIKYYSHSGGPNIYCRPGMISFVFSKIINNADGTDADLFLPPTAQQNKLDLRRHWEDEITNKKISTIISRADLVLLNANPNAQITGVNEQAYYENYYTSYTPESGVNHARTYKTIVYNSIYPHIDMLINAKPGGVEYEFAIFPGGNVNDIQMKWNGLKSMELMQNGGFHYLNKMIDMQDTKPVSSLSNGADIPSNFIKNHHIISFSVADYDHSQTLIIDPTITWGTYLGTGGRDYPQAVWTDASGNIMMCGPCTSTSKIATAGAYQTVFAGSNSDAFLAKFSASGSIQWCTFYGGTGYNDGWGLSSDNLDDIFMGGATSSSSGISTSGAYQSLYAGTSSSSYNGYIAKFRPDGSRVWATYYGSTANDQILFVATDAASNVYGVAWASTTTGLASSGAYQTACGGGFDAGIAKYDSSGSKQLWSTYYGGKGTEEVSSVATDFNGNALITGYTTSTSAIASPGAFQTSFGGNIDGFVASFSSSGSLNWATYQGGSGIDIGWGIASDQFNNVYVNGQTASATGIEYNIPYQIALAGKTNSYLSKFSAKGSLIWSTYYGGNAIDTANNLAVDPSGSVFVTGCTTSSSGIATKGAYSTANSGSESAFFSKFSPAGNLMYGSYFGGSGTLCNAYDIHADANGNTYIAGLTNSSSGIATSGGYSTNNGGARGAFLASFFFNSYANDAGIAIMPTGYCAGKQTVKAMLENFGSSTLTSATIGWALNGKVQTPISWSGTLYPDSITPVTLGTFTFSGGTDTFKVWTSKPNGVIDSMPQNDTMLTKVLFVSYPKVSAGGNKTLCAGSSTYIGSSTGSGVTYSWTSNPSGFVSNSMQPKISPTVNTTYYLTETTTIGSCSASDSATITVGQIPTPNAGISDTICYGGSQFMGGAPVKGHAYAWSSVPVGFTSTISKPLVSPKVTTIYYETEIDTIASCVAYSSATITVSPEAVSNAGGNKSICPKGSVSIGINAVSGHSYNWTSSPAGFTSTKSNPTVSPDTVTTYYFSDILNSTGCTAGDSAVVSINPLPLANSGGNQTICAGTSLQLGSTAVSGDTYSWKSKPTGFSSTSSSPTVNPTSTTDYFITETITETGCTRTDTAIVTTNPLPTPKAGGNQVICIGGNVQLGAAATPGHSYLWASKPTGFSSNSAFPTVSPTVTTTYYVTEIINATNCYKKDSAVVKVNSETASAGPDFTVCAGQPDTLGVKSVSGTTYSWTSDPTGFTGFTSNPVVKPTVTTTYYLEASSNATGCNGFDTVVVSVNPVPLADAGHNMTICAGSGTDIGDTTSAVDSFSWTSSPSGFTSDYPNPSVNPIATTVYHLTETDPNTGCNRTNSVIVTVNPVPDPEWFITYVGDVAYIHAVDSSLNHGSYLWNLGDGDTASGHVAKHLYHKNQQYSIRLTITGSDGCISGFDSIAKILYSGIEQNSESDFGLNVFPNPFQTSATIEYNLNTNGKIKIVLFDITGKQIGVIADENQVPGSYHFDINAEKYHLSPGMYLIQFENKSSVNSQQSTVKMVHF